MNTAHKNVMLYWSDDNPPSDVIAVVDHWRRICRNWDIALFSRRTSYQFLESFFGHDIAELFKSCAIPAMQSDFFRVFWAIVKGGVYCDMTFAPKREPLFFSNKKSITLPKWDHGRIVNGIFYAEKESPNLKLVAYEIIKSTSLKTEKNIWVATGPGAWIRALGETETDSVAFIEKAELFKDYFGHSGYVSTRGTDQHWSVRQLDTSIYSIGASDL